MEVLISTWLPRSYIHLREAFSKLDKTGLDISDIKFENGLSFVINEIGKKWVGEFIYYPTGLITVKVRMKKSQDPSILVEAVQKIISEQLIKTWHVVTYKQVKTGVVPLKYSVIIFDKESKYDSLDQSLIVETSRKEYKSSDLKVWRSYQFAKILNLVLYQYMETMIDFYDQADKVNTSL